LANGESRAGKLFIDDGAHRRADCKIEKCLKKETLEQPTEENSHTDVTID